jgi:hypothetical protein
MHSVCIGGGLVKNLEIEDGRIVDSGGFEDVVGQKNYP